LARILRLATKGQFAVPAHPQVPELAAGYAARFGGETLDWITVINGLIALVPQIIAAGKVDVALLESILALFATPPSPTPATATTQGATINWIAVISGLIALAPQALALIQALIALINPPAPAVHVHVSRD
jgi:hypothetical protein